jgi:hypothetical protein
VEKDGIKFILDSGGGSGIVLQNFPLRKKKDSYKIKFKNDFRRACI